MANLILLVQGEIEELFSHIHQVIVNSRLARKKAPVRNKTSVQGSSQEKGRTLAVEGGVLALVVNILRLHDPICLWSHR